MALRESLEKNPTVAIGLVAVLIAIAAAIMLTQSGRPTPSGNQGYFFDLGAGELFIADLTARPPIDSPTGPGQGVAAAVYACGDCADEADRFIAYIQTLESVGEDEWRSMIALPPKAGDPPRWIPADARAAGPLINAPTQRCNGNTTRCKP